jgi:hypothetical protein
MIKYGSIEYFELLDLRDRIASDKYNKFDLVNLDKLRFEVNNKIAAIELSHKRPRLDRIDRESGRI